MKFTILVLLALCLQSLYGAVDLFVVGQFGSAADVSAVATGTQIMHTITGIIANLSMGTTIMLGQAIGSGKKEDEGDIVKSSIVFFCITAIICMIGMFMIAKLFATLMHAPIEAYEKTVGYVIICSLGMIFFVAYNVLGAIFRKLGN